MELSFLRLSSDGRSVMTSLILVRRAPVNVVSSFSLSSSLFLGTHHSKSADVKQIAENLFYLGRGGIKTVGKLTVAFLGASHTSEGADTVRRVRRMGACSTQEAQEHGDNHNSDARFGG